MTWFMDSMATVLSWMNMIVAWVISLGGLAWWFFGWLGYLLGEVAKWFDDAGYALVVWVWGQLLDRAGALLGDSPSGGDFDFATQLSSLPSDLGWIFPLGYFFTVVTGTYTTVFTIRLFRWGLGLVPTLHIS